MRDLDALIIEPLGKRHDRAAFSWCARHGAQRHELALDNRGAKANREVTRR